MREDSEQDFKMEELKMNENDFEKFSPSLCNERLVWNLKRVRIMRQKTEVFIFLAIQKYFTFK